jgi:hypothetical protein
MQTATSEATGGRAAQLNCVPVILLYVSSAVSPPHLTAPAQVVLY